MLIFPLREETRPKTEKNIGNLESNNQLVFDVVVSTVLKLVVRTSHLLFALFTDLNVTEDD
jgi:hypothetical protein